MSERQAQLLAAYRDPSRVPESVTAMADCGSCDGACTAHSGAVRPAFVDGWGWFSYCETAVAEDISRGLTVSPFAGA